MSGNEAVICGLFDNLHVFEIDPSKFQLELQRFFITPLIPFGLEHHACQTVKLLPHIYFLARISLLVDFEDPGPVELLETVEHFQLLGYILV